MVEEPVGQLEARRRQALEGFVPGWAIRRSRHGSGMRSVLPTVARASMAACAAAAWDSEKVWPMMGFRRQQPPRSGLAGQGRGCRGRSDDCVAEDDGDSASCVRGVGERAAGRSVCHKPAARIEQAERLAAQGGSNAVKDDVEPASGLVHLPGGPFPTARSGWACEMLSA